MRVAIRWIIAGTLLAVTVLGAVSAQNVRGVVIWMVSGVAVAAGLGAMTAPVESPPPRGGVGLLLAVLRPMLAVAAGVVTLLSTMVAGCNDVDGVPSWERCHTWWAPRPSTGQEHHCSRLRSVWASATSSGDSSGGYSRAAWSSGSAPC